MSIPGSRTGSGGWRPGEPRGIRAFNYNEDDSTNLNQSYVDRVLGLPQNSIPGVNSQSRTNEDQIHAAHPGASGHFGVRHQSVDVALRRGPPQDTSNIFSQHRPSHD